MNNAEKMQVLRNSVQYAVDGGMGCMDCLKYGNGYPALYGSGWGFVSAYGPTKTQVQGVIEAILQVGLTPEEVDAYMKDKGAVEGGRGTDLSHGRIGGCVGPDEFLKHMRDLLSNV